MPTFDIVQITRTRLRFSVMADTMEEAKRLFFETGGSLQEDETLEVLEEFVFERATDKDVTAEWDDIEIKEG